MIIEIHIEKLVLSGFERVDRGALRMALDGELTRLITDGGAPLLFDQSTQISYLSGGSFDAPAGVSAYGLGVGVANTLYQSMRRGQGEG